ncbi:MAG TPA: PorV/PorQ family protein [Candidatus Limnocylindrales bacterium]|nr:PorV/PorQ family protein [Candidatus Limnocylindrales bacterium]
MRALVMKFVLPAALLSLAGTACAGGLDRMGTAGAQELRIPVGAASVAIGGSATALGNGIANLYYNPASLAATDNAEAIVSYSTWLSDSKVNYGAVSTKVGSAGLVALSIKVLNIGDIIVTTEEASEGTGEILNPTYSVFGLSYARRMTDRVLIGLTANYVNEKVAQSTASGFAADLGVQYDTGWRGLRFGFAMKNIGPNMQFSGPDFEERISLPGDDPSAQPHVVQLESTEFELPSYMQLGVAYDLGITSNQHATVYGSFQGNNFSTDEYRIGAEYLLGEHIALRGGYVGQMALKEADRQSNYLYSYSYGAGLNFKLGDRPLNFDWAGTHLGEFFDDNQQVSLKIAF